MKDLIKEIVAADKASRLEIQRAEERRDALAGELDEQTRAFDKKCADEAKAKIEMACAQLESGLEEYKTRITGETAKKSEALKAEFNEKHAEWEKAILGRIIG
ncbi:MAG: hypothetical protein Q3968_05470 [Clostridiaceae bacterium]|jgi:hypothetical protein|nr:hypothetical protein [Clostridiaceae bacterium]